MLAAKSRAYSSQVQIRLYTGGFVLSVAQVGEDSLILREVHELKPADGIIVVAIDGVERRFPIRVRECKDRVVRFDEFCQSTQPMLFDDDRNHPDCPF